MANLDMSTDLQKTSAIASAFRAIGCLLMLTLGGVALVAAVFFGRYADIEVLVFFGLPGVLCTSTGIIFAVAKNKHLLILGASLALAHFGAIGYVVLNW